MARSIRLFQKKRGDRRTGSHVVGGLSEALFFGVLFLLGATSLTYLIASQVLVTAQPIYQPGFGFWLMILVTSSFTLIGGGGVIYTVLQVGTSTERRSAMVQRATDLDLIGDARLAQRTFPTIPRDANLTNSPGVRLAYRLPVTHGGAWVLLSSALFFLIWNGVALILITVAIKSHLNQKPDWFLTIFALSFLVIGIWAAYFFVKQMLLHTGIGPTNVEISDHPLYPGRQYDLFVSQAGRLQVHSLAVSLVCEEQTTYRQGTDIRTDHCCVYREQVLLKENFRIEPSRAFQCEGEFTVPTGVIHSFQASYNAVSWKLEVCGDVKSWPAFMRSFPVVVYPPENEQGTD